ncbi:MAG: bifunctional aspartate kinase/homoserine dehydrogenase I, partial [Rikenellaceae bacterium]|nr:bifunctional aspartate kinase/homoserine dehydrogenase I [Rikenellaceae bacterium]
NQRIREEFATLPQRTVMGGFISSDRDSGDVTNLGRGGSDYTAAIVAAALDADLLEIWTDVDGFMTADPRVINSTYIIDHLTFAEATELCNFGAKVVYPPTIFPVYHKNIPIRIRNTFNPEAAGTLISNEHRAYERSIKGISSINDTCLLTIQGLGMVGVIGVNHRIFRTLALAGISVYFVAQAASENTTSIGVNESDSAKAVEELTREFAKEISQGEINDIIVMHNLATVAIVGENMKHTPGVAGRLFNTLGRNGINVIACSQGASETNISFVISLDSLRKALNVIHDSYFLSEYQVLNVFVAGVGLVGSNLLDQIAMQQKKLAEENSLKINVVGIANSRRMIINRDGIDLKDYRRLLAESSLEASSQTYTDEIIRTNIFNSVFVDCTASHDVAQTYQKLLDANVSVVAANKIAASSDYDSYDRLKKTARRRGIKFLYETNVGAGLPIISTIGSLVKSGDRISRIEAVVSGTLNYIFDVMSADVPLSKAIKMACEAGYAEPDPRIDLSGMDVVRKLVILAREAEYSIEQSDVEKNLFIPDKYFEGSLEEFWAHIPELDAQFEAERKRLEEKGLRWRFVAEFDRGKATVGLREVAPDNSFYNLSGSNNVISLTTERYKEHPMQIKGYGAGASVTAAGVFADLISIANVR